MANVKNRKIVTKIAMRSMKSRKTRNLIAVLAIALTALLFTSLFTIGGSIIQKLEEATMRQVGTSYHGGYKYLTWEQYEKLEKDPAVQDLSFRIAVSSADNPELLKVPTEIGYYEDENAKHSFCYPAEGHMPREKYEITASSLTLEALGIPCEVGQKVTLDFTVHGKKYQQEFILSGWYEGDPIMAVQPLCVSKEYAEEVAPMPSYSFQEGSGTTDDIAGRLMAEFNFRSSFNIEGKMEKLTARLGFENIPDGVNWAYMSSSFDPETAVGILVFLAVIMLSGYLIIYNIFYINVYEDIRFYGLLKTIGTTGRQLRRMVRRQAWMLSLAGIPIGLILGWITGRLLLPQILKNLTIYDTVNYKASMDPRIFIGAALFSLVTVYISCVRPCRIAARVSPVEAARYTEGQEKAGRNRRKKEHTKKTKKITMAAFAIANLKRSRKKAAVVILSLSLSLIILNSVYTLVTGFHMEAYVSRMSISDFYVTDATVDNTSSSSRNTADVPEDFLEELKAQPDVTETGNVYFQSLWLTFTDEEYQRFRERIWSRTEELFAHWLKTIPEIEEELQKYQEALSLDGKIYGIEELIFQNLELSEGELDWEKFQSGNYIIINSMEYSDKKSPVNFYDPGESITLTNENGETKTYQVMAVASMPYAAELQSYGLIDLTYILPVEEFNWYCGPQQPMKTFFNVREGSEKEMTEWVADYCSQTAPNLTYTSRETIIAEFSSMKWMITAVGSLLSFILALIGVLNFINTIITSILSRRREFAMIEAVGMTGKQLRHMLIFEGLYYALYTLIVTVLLGSLLSLTIMRSIQSSLSYFQWHFTVLPLLLCLPLLFLTVWAVPLLSYRKICRESVVDRIRTF